MAAEAKFKVGDRVRRTKVEFNGMKTGDLGTVSRVSRGWIGIAEFPADEDLSPFSEDNFELATVWHPKVGDRVISSEPSNRNERGVIVKDNFSPYLTVKFDTWRRGHDGINLVGDVGKDHWLISPEDLRLDSFVIEAGKFYKTADGRKFGPMKFRTEFSDYIVVEGDGNVWAQTGKGCHTFTPNLVAEWVDEPKASNDNGLLSSLIGKTVTVQVKAPVQPKFKVGDRVRPSHGLSKSTATVTNVIGNQISVKWNDGAIGSTNGWTAGELDLVTAPAIVALIENGQPKPSSMPHVHATEADAAKEAARLAGKHKGQQFGVFVLTTTSQEAAPTYRHEWQRLAAKGEKIAAIKELRSITGLGLKATKDAVEHWVANDEPYSRVAA